MLHAEWKGGANRPAVIEVTSRFATQDRAADLSGKGSATPLSEADRLLYTGATDLIPIDGQVKGTADNIIAGATGDMEKARRIYDWIVENCFRDPTTKGCGDGNVARMLATNNFGGKCADLNGLYIALARAAGLPARDVYGLRVAPSAFGYKSLGAGSANVTKAQHCRAEVHIAGHGWIAVDPADVRKVMLQEAPGNLELRHPKVAAARETLFGAWEGNWAAYNFAHDVALPGAEGEKLGFLMYPQAEIAGRRLDCLDPDAFRYTITAREITAG
jgi:transglutaminase-like putative cysteine protease